VAVRAVRAAAAGARRARRGADGGGGRRVRHPGAALVRIDGGGAGGVPQSVRPAGRADARQGTAPGSVTGTTVPRSASDRLVCGEPGLGNTRAHPVEAPYAGMASTRAGRTGRGDAPRGHAGTDPW